MRKPVPWVPVCGGGHIYISSLPNSGVLKHLKHLYLLINVLREMQEDSFPIGSFYPLTMEVLRDALADVRYIASEFGRDWEEGVRLVFSERPRLAAQMIHLNRVVASGEVDNPVRASSLLGTALPLLREFYATVREKLEEF